MRRPPGPPGCGNAPEQFPLYVFDPSSLPASSVLFDPSVFSPPVLDPPMSFFVSSSTPVSEETVL